MKKKEVYVGVATNEVKFPSSTLVKVDDEKAEKENGSFVYVKNVIPGSKIEFRYKKTKQGILHKILEKSSDEINKECKDFGTCGACIYQTLDYKKQLEIKEAQVKEIIAQSLAEYEYKEDEDIEKIKKRIKESLPFEKIYPSPKENRYRNKMEYTFGDEKKGGEITLGLHKRGSRYDIVNTTECYLVEDDFNKIVKKVTEWARDEKIPFYHTMQETGILRHLVVRRSETANEILVNLVTTSAVNKETLSSFVECLKTVECSGKIVSILHTTNDSKADAVICEKMEILYGRDYLYEEILGLKFKISPFSFFQTNTKGAEVLYEKVREYAMCEEEKKPIIFDLYSGTGTIAQIMAAVASYVVGVEIVEEAVKSACENAKINELENCKFIANDVLKALDEIEEKPDLIILDPPRDGVNKKALAKILDYGVKNIIYISCKITSFARDLHILKDAGYEIKKISCVDMFPNTAHVESVVLLTKVHK